VPQGHLLIFPSLVFLLGWIQSGHLHDNVYKPMQPNAGAEILKIKKKINGLYSQNEEKENSLQQTFCMDN